MKRVRIVLAVFAIAVAVVTSLQLSRTTLAAGTLCPARVMKQIDDINRKVMTRGAYAVIDAAECDSAGNISLLIIRRANDGRVTRWTPKQSAAELLSAYVGEQPK